MTSSEDLSPEARNLLRAAKGYDRATPNEVSTSVERFLQYRARDAHTTRNTWFTFREKQRVAPWAVVAAIFSATLGAYATVGQSLGLPVPRWWPESAIWTSLDTATSEQPNAAHVASNDQRATHAAGESPRLTAVEGQRTEDAHPVLQPATSSVVPPVVVAPDVVASEPVTVTERPVAPAPKASSPTAKPPLARGSIAASVTPPSTKPSPTVVTPTEVSSLSREVQTITAARDALDAGNCALATRHLDNHRVTFPKGALREERQALTAICQCRTGAGTTAAQSYLAARTDTPLTRRVAKECGIGRAR